MERASLQEPLLCVKQKTSGNEKTVSTYAGSGFWSRLTFSWLNSLLRLGYSRPLIAPDVPNLGKEDNAEVLYGSLRAALEIQKGESRKLAFALLRCHWKHVLFTGMLALIRTLAISLGPVFLYLFVDIVARSQRQKEETGTGSHLRDGVLLILVLTFVKVAQSVSHRHWSFQSRHLGVKVRGSVLAAVYDKTLKLSSKGRQRHASGEVVSYIGVDSYRLGELSWWLHYSWAALLQLVLALVVLFSTVGYATLACILVLVVTLLLQIPISRALQKSQTNLMTAQDERLRRTTEVLNSMKIIKLQAWEEEFKHMIDTCREKELNWLYAMFNRRSLVGAVFWLSYASGLSLTLVTYALLGNDLNAAVIFTVFSAFSNTQEPVKVVPEILATLSQAMVSLSRLDVFLNDDEVPETAAANNIDADNRFAIRIHGPASFSWGEQSNHTLSEIDLQIKPGDKVAICGAVGSGKSSLLCAILGEIPTFTGNVQVNGSIAYVSQVAWIQSGTIRDNILFGKPMCEGRYWPAVRACALEKDLEMFAYGDLTEIGDRGLNLSGGQKQRIQLARAVYNDADIYLLDDPFSAVDAQTAATLFHECVMKSLSKKTVVLVTHQVEFLPNLDIVMVSCIQMNRELMKLFLKVMEAGGIGQQGAYNEIMKKGLALNELVTAHHNTLNNALSKGSNVKSAGNTTQHHSYVAKYNQRDSGGEQGVQLTEEEEKEIGDLGLQPYKDYLSIAKGHLLLVLELLTQAGLVSGSVTGGLWLAIQIMKPGVDSTYIAYGYTVIAYATSVFLIARLFIHTALTQKASKAFFGGLLTSIFRAPMSFFDSTPTGRILSRFSNDMSLLDVDIRVVGNILIGYIFDFPGVMVVLGLVLWPALLIIFPMLWAIVKIESYYRVSAQELMRLSAMTKAPILTLAAESISGAVTIRAFSMKERFKGRYAKLIDRDSTLYFHTNGAIEWLVVRVEACGGVLLLIFGLGLSAMPDISSGLAGVGLAYALTINISLVFLSQWYCQMASHIVSVERIKQYMNVPLEPPAIVESSRPPIDWPNRGEIILHDLQIKYRTHLPLVLRGISCKIEGGKRVGVVGRTGSGKSTLISAIFRLVDPAGGKIVIDGIDICSIGLRDLRSKLGIVPQEPTLFRGTVRTNLDPLRKYSDADIWEALDKCQMGKEIRGMSSQLDSSVTDEGGNWSAGQRQLFCLGRVLLKHTRVLVLDEATASIDSSTDATLQRVIRDEFRTCTVVTVAHRIPTVIDSDMVLTLEDGLLAEYQPPLVLLENKNSSFANLVAEYWAQRTCK